jgi:23S rRNA (guanosine2251-2'-O)-methyltransferase
MSEQSIYGIHAVAAAIEHQPESLREVLISANRDDKRTQSLIEQAKEQGVGLRFVSKQQLDSLVGTVNHQGVAALMQVKSQVTEADLPELLEAATNPILLILDSVQDPHNLGACLRSANAAGVTAVIAPKDKAASLTPTVRKVACGAAELTPFIQVTNLARLIRELKQQGVWIYGLAGEGEQSLFQAELKGPIAMVLGSEGAGLRQLTRQLCDALLYIPMAGAVSSLNVSAACSVTLFEAVRQRQA